MRVLNQVLTGWGLWGFRFASGIGISLDKWVMLAGVIWGVDEETAGGRTLQWARVLIKTNGRNVPGKLQVVLGGGILLCLISLDGWAICLSWMGGVYWRLRINFLLILLLYCWRISHPTLFTFFSFYILFVSFIFKKIINSFDQTHG